MAMHIPQHHQTRAATTNSAYTVDKLYYALVSRVKKEWDDSGTLDKAIYQTYWHKLSSNKDIFVTKIKASLDAAVASAQLNGYDLLNHSSLLNLSMDKLIQIINLDETVNDIKGWVDTHYESTLDALKTYIDSVTAQIPDEVTKIKAEIDKEFNQELSAFGLDVASIQALSALGLKITEFKDKIEKEYEVYHGTPFDPSETAFYEKSSFKLHDKILEEMATDEFTAAIAPTVKRQMQVELTALDYRPGVTIRDLRRDVYNHEVKGTILTPHDIDAKYIAGFEALVNKYTAGGKVHLNEIGVSNKFTSATDVEIEVYAKLSIENSHFEVFGRQHNLVMSPTLIERMRNHAFSALSQANMGPSQFKEESMWTEGQELTKQDLMDNYIPAVGTPDLTDLFSRVDAFLKTEPSAEFKFFYKHGKIEIQFVDKSIAPSDFDYGDKTPLTTNAKLRYWFNRHNSVTKAPQYSNPHNSHLFSPSHIFNFEFEIQLVSKMDEIANRLKAATTPEKQDQDSATQSPKPVPIKELLKVDGTPVDVDRTLLTRIFPSIQADFFTEMDKSTGYTISFELTDVDHKYRGDTTITATITSPTMQKKTVAIHVQTLNEDEVIDEAESALTKYENTWEDQTPSVRPEGFDIAYGTNDHLFLEHTTPPLDQLKTIFPDIEKFFVDYKGNPLLKILETTEETKDSQLTIEMLESWNKDLADALGGITQDIRDKLSAALIASEFSGLSKESRYSYANIQISAPTTKTHKLIAVRYLSHQQRYIENLIAQGAGQMFIDVELKKMLDEHKIEGDLRQQIINDFTQRVKVVTDHVASILKPNDPNAFVPDFELHKINTYVEDIRQIVKDIQNQYKLNEDDLAGLKKASKAFKWILTSVGGLIGVSALLALLIPIRIALGDRKFRKENPKVKRSSKKIILISAISGLLAAGSSVAIMLYVFITQGGL